MTRPETPPDSDLGDAVALTALMVAAARAIETHRADSLAEDRYAEHFVRAARASATWPVRPRDVGDAEADPLWGRLGRYFGLRTRVLDDFLLRSTAEGTRQVVLLGAGLDSRAFRLDWPAATVVYEIDRAPVLAFKDRVLAGLGAVPRAARVPLAVDLRGDFSGELLRSGFDPAAPTAWLAEGLLLYLPSAVERQLLGTVARLSVAGSALFYEIKLDHGGNHAIYAATIAHLGLDLLSLFDKDPRPDSAAALAALGWRTAVHTPFDFTRRFGRGPRPEPDDDLAGNRWIFAHREPAATVAPRTLQRSTDVT